MALLLTVLPESPVFLLSMGRHEDAQKSLQFLRGANRDVSDEMERIADNLKYQNKLGKVSAKQALVGAVYRWPLLIMMGLFLFRQLTGNMAVGYYLTEIFEEADTGLDPGLEATLVTLSQVLANFVTAGSVGEDTLQVKLNIYNALQVQEHPQVTVIPRPIWPQKLAHGILRDDECVHRFPRLVFLPQ